jgi:hypothetical protein
MKRYATQFAMVLPALVWFVFSRNYEPFRSHLWLDVLTAIVVCAAVDSVLFLIYFKMKSSQGKN